MANPLDTYASGVLINRAQWSVPPRILNNPHEGEREIDAKERCGAKNRQGNPCQRWPLAGRTRCRLHGGAAGSGRPPTTFLYRKHLPTDQHATFDQAKVDSLDDEIRLAKSNLDAALEAGVDGDIIHDHLDVIRRLVDSRVKLVGREGFSAVGALERFLEDNDATPAAE